MTTATSYPSAAYVAELGAVRRHNARAFSWSVTIHFAVLVWLILQRVVSGEAQPLVEVSWLEPDIAVAAAAPAAAEPMQVASESIRIAPLARETERFQREHEESSLEPLPQRPDALADRLDNSLQALRSTKPNLAVASTGSNLRGKPSMAVGSGNLTNSTGLVRSSGTGPVGAPTELRRSGKATTGRPTLAVAPAGTGTQRAPAIATPDENSAQRSLGGAQLVGPVADRDVITHRLPEYPAWAMREAVEASVTLYFIVLPNGQVKDNILVQKTSGHADFDANAQAALRAWRFEELSRAAEQWGTITFHFKLRDR